MEHLHSRFEVFFTTQGTSKVSVDSLKCVLCPSHRGIHLIERESIVKVKKKKTVGPSLGVLLRELSLEKWTKNSQLRWGRGWHHSKCLQRECITSQVYFPFLDKIFIFPTPVSDQEWPQSHIFKTPHCSLFIITTSPLWIALDFTSLFNSKWAPLSQTGGRSCPRHVQVRADRCFVLGI